VEEKLLIGDRPKQTADFDKKLSLRDRLLQQNTPELANVSTIPHVHLHFVAKFD
jgi:N-terminal acetyltransferase B complex non-catalytic subunit